MKSVDLMSLWNAVCSVHLCFSVRKRIIARLAKEVFLSQSAQSSRSFWRTVWAHRTPSAYRVHRALLLKVAVRFCDIGWLNVSVECCVFCSSVFSVRNRTHPLYEITHKQHAGKVFLSQSAQSSRSFLAHISSPQNASGIQSSQSVTAKDGC